MRVEAVKELLRALGCRQLKTSGNKVLATCPFEHEHSSGRDSHPSFVVFANDTECSGFNCSYPHSTRALSVGSMESLVERFSEVNNLPVSAVPWGTWEDKGPSLNSLLRFVWTHDLPTGEDSPEVAHAKSLVWDPSVQIRKAHGLYAPAASIPDAPEAKALPPSTLDVFEAPEGPALQYLRDRGLDEETIEHWEILYDPEYDRILIPIRDMGDALVGLSRRALYDYQDPKYLHSKGFSRNNFLFGEAKKHREPVSNEKCSGIVVEGQFDVIRLWQYGYRGAVAVFGASMSIHQAVKFSKMFSDAIILTDGDEGGEKAVKQVTPALDEVGISYEVVRMPAGLDPGDVRFTPEMAQSLLGSPKVDKGRFPWE